MTLIREREVDGSFVIAEIIEILQKDDTEERDFW